MAIPPTPFPSPESSRSNLPSIPCQMCFPLPLHHSFCPLTLPLPAMPPLLPTCLQCRKNARTDALTTTDKRDARPESRKQDQARPQVLTLKYSLMGLPLRSMLMLLNFLQPKGLLLGRKGLWKSWGMQLKGKSSIQL